MKFAFRRLLSLLLVIILCASMVPAAFAAETETKPTSVSETEPLKEEFSSQDMETDSYGIATASEDYGIMTVSGSQLTSISFSAWESTEEIRR